MTNTHNGADSDSPMSAPHNSSSLSPPSSHPQASLPPPSVYQEEPPRTSPSSNSPSSDPSSRTTPSQGTNTATSILTDQQQVSSPNENEMNLFNATTSLGAPPPPAATHRFDANDGAWNDRAGTSTYEGGSSKMADAIGGAGVGTAATGDLSAPQPFESLEQIRASVSELQNEYDAKHPDAQLSGRIIHVALYIPFVVRSLAEVDFERRREERIAATADVAALAAAARARKAERLAAKKAAEEAAAMADAAGQEDSKPARKASTAGGRAPSFSDFEQRLMENQARSKARAGRRAWMMTQMPSSNDESAIDDEEDVNSEPDRFTPGGSRRQSMLSEFTSRANSFTEAMPTSSNRKYSAVSDDTSPVSTPPPPFNAAAPPQWVLTPRRGHTALNSGIRSLCSTHKQTFIGWPGDIQFPAQARNDERTDPSQTTEPERLEIEQVLASLDTPKNWVAQDAPVMGATDTNNNDGAPPMGYVPTPLMNGAEPLVPNGDGGKTPAPKPSVSEAARAATDARPAVNGIKYVPVWLDYNVAHGHYEGYCKTTLWPLFHYLLWQDVPADRHGWEDYSWDAYYAANEAFAQRIAAEYKPGDIVWIHDYHLLLVPLMLRKLVPDAHIGLFVHAPFPSSEVFRCLPKRREIVEGMLGADLACFQAFSYSRHFLSSCIRVCGFEASSNSVESHNGHITNISYNPIGIDANKIARDCAMPGVLPKAETIREMYKGKRIIVGRDKLDVVRGVIQKLQAFGKFLEEFPEWRDRVVLIQVTAPALNDSPKLERQVSELVSQINGEFGSLSFTPVHHYHQIIEKDEYFALLSVADLALITSVRDGMNTTSMEYVVAQERTNKSPLILSEFTGTAGRMRSAIQVNPWNIFGVAKAIDYGLRLSEQERVGRHDSMYHQVVSHTSHTWAARLVKQLLVRLLSEQTAHFTPPLEAKKVVDGFHSAKKRMLLLDYDGTLTPIVKNPDDALPSKKLLAALEILSQDSANLIYIISGRDQAFLSKHLGHLGRMGFSAEHGCFVKEPGEQDWHNMTKELDMTWMRDVRSVFEYYTERTSGSAIEQKKSSITWHYRNSDPDFGSFQAKECQAHLENLVTQSSLAVEVMVGKKNLEVRPLAVNKGEIVKRILYNNIDAEFVFCAGDDKTDEDMFRTLAALQPQNENPFNASHADAAVGNLKVPPLAPKVANPSRSRERTRSTSSNLTLGGSAASEDSPLVMSAPAPMSSATPWGSPRVLSLRRENIFTTTIGPSGKKTLANWHVDGTPKIIDVLATLAGNAPGGETE